MVLASRHSTPPPVVQTSGWVLGTAIYLLGAGLIVLGENLVKRSAAPEFTVDTDEPLQFNRGTKTWSAGVTFFVAGNAAHFVAFMFAPQAMLEALGASVLLWNLLFASQINREQIRRGHLLSTAVIIAGTIIALYFGPHHSNKYSMHELLNLFTRHGFLAYEASLLVMVSALQAVYSYETRRIAVTGREGPYSAWIIQFSYAGVSAGIGGNSVIFSKCVAETVHHWTKAGLPQEMSVKKVLVPILVVFVWFGLMCFWLYRLNEALKRFSALYIVPVLQALWMSNTVMGGGIFFGEFVAASVGRILMFGSGICVILIGICLMPCEEEKIQAPDLSEQGLLYSAAEDDLTEGLVRGSLLSDSSTGAYDASGSTPMINAARG